MSSVSKWVTLSVGRKHWVSVMMMMMMMGLMNYSAHDEGNDINRYNVFIIKLFALILMLALSVVKMSS